MILPVRDTEQNRYGETPMLVFIIALAVIVWGIEVLAASDTKIRHLFFGVSPALILAQDGLGALSSITALFLHSGLRHLFFNMWALWVFGRRVEDACGSWRFLAFYLVCGLTADIAFILVRADSYSPGIGASGAIYGVMGAYLILYPGGRIRTLVLFPFPPFAIWPRLQAFWVTIFFVGTEILPALDVLAGTSTDHIAHWAHLGGFLGSAFILFFLRPQAFRRYINHLPV